MLKRTACLEEEGVCGRIKITIRKNHSIFIYFNDYICNFKSIRLLSYEDFRSDSVMVCCFIRDGKALPFCCTALRGESGRNLL